MTTFYVRNADSSINSYGVKIEVQPGASAQVAAAAYQAQYPADAAGGARLVVVAEADLHVFTVTLTPAVTNVPFAPEDL